MLAIDPAEVLLTVAEVAIAFAGFASLIAIFGIRSTRTVQVFDLLRYWVMLEFSIAALAFALFPLVMGAIGLSDAFIWRGSSALMAAFVIVHNVVLARWFFAGLQTVRAAATPANVVSAYLVYATIALSQLANALSNLDHQAGWYLFGLFFVLVVASAHFVLFIHHAIQHLKQD